MAMMRNPNAAPDTLRLALAYMYGASSVEVTKEDLRARLNAAKADPELKGKVREVVLSRYQDMIANYQPRKRKA